MAPKIELDPATAMFQRCTILVFPETVEAQRFSPTRSKKNNFCRMMRTVVDFRLRSLKGDMTRHFSPEQSLKEYTSTRSTPYRASPKVGVVFAASRRRPPRSLSRAGRNHVVPVLEHVGRVKPADTDLLSSGRAMIRHPKLSAPRGIIALSHAAAADHARCPVEIYFRRKSTICWDCCWDRPFPPKQLSCDCR